MDNGFIAAMLSLIFGLLCAPIIFILLDLWSGIRKAKRRGEAITSMGWRRTVTKFNKYYNLLLALLAIDFVQLAACYFLVRFNDVSIPMYPWMLTIGDIAVGAIEFKSIYEKAEDKVKKDVSEVGKLAGAIAANRTDPEAIAEEVVKYLNEHDTEWKQG